MQPARAPSHCLLSSRSARDFVDSAGLPCWRKYWRKPRRWLSADMSRIASAFDKLASPEQFKSLRPEFDVQGLLVSPFALWSITRFLRAICGLELFSVDAARVQVDLGLETPDVEQAEDAEKFKSWVLHLTGDSSPPDLDMAEIAACFWIMANRLVAPAPTTLDRRL